MEEIRLWKLVKTAQGLHTAEAISATDHTTTEKLLEEMLTTTPELLMDGLSIVGRQNETATGPLDLLGVDEDGRLVVFELKRGTLTREAVAQALDYASFLADLSEDGLNQHITSNSGKYEVPKMEDFRSWYQNKFQKNLATIGKPRIVLVGVGVDETTKRITNFLSEGDLNISIVTFHAFLEGGQTYFAKQVEARNRTIESGTVGTKAGNRAELHKLLDGMGMRSDYERLSDIVCTALGAGTYQWPLPTGYTYSRPTPSANGGVTRLTYVTLYADQKRPGDIRIYLQPTAANAVGPQRLQEIAMKAGGIITKTASGTATFWMKAAGSNQRPLLQSLASAIADGLQAHTELTPEITSQPI